MDKKQLGGSSEGVPAQTAKQQRFFGAELERKREGEKTETGLSEDKLSEMATKPEGGYPGKVGAGGGGDKKESSNPYMRARERAKEGKK